MASTVKTSTLSVIVQEEITLSGQTTNRRNQHDIRNINEVNTRILTVPTYAVNLLILSSSAAAGTYITSKLKYCRLTNLDDTYHVTLSFVSGSAGSANTCDFKLEPKRTMIFTNSSISGSATNASFGSFSNFTNLKGVASGSAVDVELFIATI